ncbi:ABC transporter substrate-binding protein [Streptomyces flaveus]|uniref:ABC transporter substrate-binding protein n=2 Tax=Streptomyces flaveus TaxID=66370 RepID=A0A917RFB6_9ACTN|nr:ABC transporter substrate-binding protein [Streptomyces flaveus]
MPTIPLIRCLLALALLLGAVGCGESKQRVTIMVPWSDDEFRAFDSVVRAFEDEHDGRIEVDVQVTRDLTQQLDAAVVADAPPDLAVLPSIAALHKYAGEKLSSLEEMDTSSFVQPFRGLGMEGGKVYAVPVKADVKSLVWHGPDVTGPLPRSWPAFRDRTERWCLGLESGPVSGWPGADWIADILLAQEGVATYKKWLSGGADWDSKPMVQAWTTWRDLVEKRGLDGASTREFRAATAGMTKPSATCSLSHGALSATAFEQRDVKDGKYRFEAPTPKLLQVSADYIGKFTKEDDPDNASADELIAYLASPEGQRAWVNAPTSYALSAHEAVTRYDNSTTQRDLASLLRSDATLCFSAADAMDPDVSAAFYRAVLDYARGTERDPTRLLRDLDNVRTTPPRTLTDDLCATRT